MLRILKYSWLILVLGNTFAEEPATDLYRNSRLAKSPAERKQIENEIVAKFPNSKHAALVKFLAEDFTGPDAEYHQLAAIRRFMSKYPGLPDAHLQKAHAELLVDSFAAAAEDYEIFRSAGLKESWGEMMIGGTVYLKNAKYSKAILKFNQAIVEYPTKLESFYWRGLTYIEMSKNQEALRDFTTCLQADPADTLLLNQCFGQRGQTFLNQRKFAEAFNEYQKALALKENVSDHHTGLAQSLLGLKRYDEAEKSALAALNLDPKDALAYLILAIINDTRQNCEKVKAYRNKERVVYPLFFVEYKFHCKS